MVNGWSNENVWHYTRGVRRVPCVERQKKGTVGAEQRVMILNTVVVVAVLAW